MCHDVEESNRYTKWVDRQMQEKESRFRQNTLSVTTYETTAQHTTLTLY